ncbi:hypothetical protein [Bifidobacterium dolichotidis]|uniref:hypothetical protein n=1 Tax=Bifidobacterium dolichotidis TaxID=2306976 RepID=UPI000F7DAAA9|nr:hypothetical protein [Bifidobacterium dolichotidis]
MNTTSFDGVGGSGSPRFGDASPFGAGNCQCRQTANQLRDEVNVAITHMKRALDDVARAIPAGVLPDWQSSAATAFRDRCSVIRRDVQSVMTRVEQMRAAFQ